MARSKAFFKNILPKTYEKKGDGYYRFGWNDNLPLEMIEAINNSGVAKKAAKKLAEFIQADGFVDKTAAEFKVNERETADKILGGISLSLSYFNAFAFHVKRMGNGTIGSITSVPLQKLRRGISGDWYYNKTIGEEKFKKDEWVKFQDFVGTLATFEDMSENATVFSGKGEILYVYDSNHYDSCHYGIPDYLSGFEDLRTSSEVSKMDLEATINGLKLGEYITFIGVDDTTKNENGITDREAIEEEFSTTTGTKKNADGLTNRFGSVLNFVETKDQIPDIQSRDPKPILEATNSKRDIIERAVCRLFSINPALLGYSDASILGNDKAIAQAISAANAAVNPYQRMITETFIKLYGNQYDWTISQVNSGYIDPAFYADMTQDERRNLIGLPPLNIQNG